MTYRVYIRNNSKVEVRDSLFPSIPLPLLFSASAFFILASLVFSGVFSSINHDETAETSKEIDLISSDIEFQTNTVSISTELPIAELPNSNDSEIEIIEIKEEPMQTERGIEEESFVVDIEPSRMVENSLQEVSSVTVHDLTEDNSVSPTQELFHEQPHVKTNIVTLSSEDELLGVIAKNNNLKNLDSDKGLKEVIVRKGDSLALIFNRLGLSSTSLHKIMQLGKTTAVLKSLNPGEVIKFEINNKDLKQLSYDYGLNKTLFVSRDSEKFNAEIIETEIEKRIKYASAEINSSLFIAGQSAGITDKVIMNLVSIYGWDIDFALDIRNGDKFAIIYEEHYKNGKKINNGPILAAEFINQGHKFRAVRYTHDNGDVNYYSDTGHNMRKAFIRTPVNFSRISSKFNLKRKHPVLNTIRAHKGVDYAAKTGTPIKATGNGVVMYRGTKGGYGRTVILKHGGKYTTLYAHMSKYAKGVTSGKRVKQGQIIGYIGSSGLATGPHLHYEFRINGVHRNPLKVKLPKALKIPDKIMADFKQQTRPILAQLDQYISQADGIASLPSTTTENSQVLAMRQEEKQPQSVTQ